MNTSTVTAEGPSGWLVLLMAIACGLIVANIYYAQTLVGLISPALGLDVTHESLIVTVTQVGYACGLIFLVPLGDMLENRRLMMITVGTLVPILLITGLTTNGTAFLIAAGLTGLGATAVQMVVPLAANLASDQNRGKVVGNVMSGLLLGIMLARPLSSLVASLFGWRAIFMASAVMMLILTVVLRLTLPYRRPPVTQGYKALLGSLLALPFTLPALRRRSLYQAAAFAGFSAFWTAVPLWLTQQFGLNQRGIALFALVGISGALMAPYAGRLADRNLERRGTLIAMVVLAASFVLAAWAGLEGHSVVGLALAGAAIDASVFMSQVLCQRTIYAIAPTMRSRVNGVFIAAFFAGGAVGSALVSPLLSAYGWIGICGFGVLMPLLALAYFLTDRETPAVAAA